MGVSTLVLAVFIAASLGLSWVSGDKEQERLQDRVAKRGVETKEVERELGNKNRQFDNQTKELSQIKKKLKLELRAKKKVERKLAYEKRQSRLAKEQREQGGAEERKVETPAAKGQEVTRRSESNTYERVDREKIRAEVEKKVKQEISELEAKLRAVEESSRRLEAEMQLKIEEEARKRAEEAWTQAELARVRAEEAAAESLALKDRLDKVKKAKEAVDAALSEQEDALILAEERLVSERAEREKLEERLENATEALDLSKAAGEEAIEGASDAVKAAEKVTSLAITPDELAEKAREIVRLDSARAAAQKELEAKSQEISLLKSRIQEIEAEKEIVSNEAFESADKLIALKEQLEMVSLRENELRDTIGERKAAYAAEFESAALAKEQSLKAANDVAVAELERKLEIASRRLNEVIEVMAELPVLKAEVESARVKEAELSAAIEVQKSAQSEELARALGEQESLLRADYGLKLAELEAKFADASIAKVEAGAAVDAEVARLQKRAAELEAQNSELNSLLHGSKIALAEANAEREIAKELIVKNVALEAKLKEAGLANLQGKAADLLPRS